MQYQYVWRPIRSIYTQYIFRCTHGFLIILFNDTIEWHMQERLVTVITRAAALTSHVHMQESLRLVTVITRAAALTSHVRGVVPRTVPRAAPMWIRPQPNSGHICNNTNITTVSNILLLLLEFDHSSYWYYYYVIAYRWALERYNSLHYRLSGIADTLGSKMAIIDHFNFWF